MKVILTARAELDLIAIGEWISRDNPVRAETFVEELYRCCLSLSDFPERFPVAGRHRGQIMRKLTYGNYLILYVVGRRHVEVRLVVHSAQDWQRRFR